MAARGDNFMKKLANQITVLLIIEIAAIYASAKVKQTYASVSTEEYKLIKTIEKDTTGKGYIDKIKILTDNYDIAYYVEIVQHNGKAYRLKTARNNILAPYGGFMPLTPLVADINNDSIPEIITFGNTNHENDLFMFEWNGHEYKLIYYGSHTAYWFKEITGDTTPELLVEDRIYGSGYEYSYLQWQKNNYKKVYYELEAGLGFDKIKNLIGILSGPNTANNIFNHPDFLHNTFTEEWIANRQNIDYAKQLKSKNISLQLWKYISEKYQRDNGRSDYPSDKMWEIQVLMYELHGTKVVRLERLLEVKTKLINAEKRDYKIDSFTIK